jgi:hypothetical protein
MMVFSSWNGVVSLLSSPLSSSRSQVRDPEVLELVPDGVCMFWAGLIEKPFEVVLRWPHLALVAECSDRDAPHARASRLAIVAVSCGRGPLKVLLAPLCRL